MLELEAPEAAQPPQVELMEDWGPGLADRAIEALITGLDDLDEGSAQLPDGFDRGVLRAVTGFAQTFTKGVDEIILTATREADYEHVAHLSRDRIAVARRLIRRPVRAQTSLEGTLRMVDDRTLECRVERPPATSVVCFFEEKDRDVVWEAGTARKFVRIIGEGEFVPGDPDPRRILASSIRVLYEELPFDADRFWRNVDIATLANEQRGSRPDHVAKAEDWFDDDEADALISAIWEEPEDQD